MSSLPLPYFLARPRAAPRAGVVVVHEGNGMGWQLLRVCERLAGEGYLAIAPDFFHRARDGAGDWQQVIAKLGRDELLPDLRDAAALLRERGVARVGITGFCMGGRVSYLAATAEVDVQASAPFYGGGMERMLGDLRCPLLAFFGGRDEYVPPPAVEAVRARHGAENAIVYPEAGHGFMRDGSESYHEPSARDAWSRLLAFFATHLG
jgi:carboxymethylenebutenolidase